MPTSLLLALLLASTNGHANRASRRHPPPDDVSRDEFVSLATGCEITGLHIRTLHRRIKDGTLPAYRVAGTRAIRVNINDLNALMIPINGAGAV